MNTAIVINDTLYQDTIIFLKYIIASAEEDVIKDTAQKFLNTYALLDQRNGDSRMGV